MAEGQALCAQQKSAEGIRLLRKAHEIDENNPLVRAVLANTLVEEAQAQVESDWREAEKLANEAFNLNPGHPMAKILRTLILDQKRETYVNECISQARKLQTSGDLAAALSRVEEALSSYPREMRLIQIKDAVQRDLQGQRRQARRRDLEQLRILESQADSATDANTRQTLGSKARELADKYVEDVEVLSSANTLLQKLNLPGITRKGSSGHDLNAGATLSFAGAPAIEDLPPAPPKPAPPKAAPPRAAQPKAAPPPPPPAAPELLSIPEMPAATQMMSIPILPPETAGTAIPVPEPTKIKPGSARRLGISVNPRDLKALGITASAIVLLLVIALLIPRRKAAPEPAAAPVQTVAVQPAPIVTPPEPDLPVMKLSSDNAKGKVVFDDQPPYDLQDAQWTLDKVPFGEHTLKFESAAGAFTVGLTSAAGTLPAIKTPFTATGVLAVVVSSMGDHIHVYASDAAAKVSLDGQRAIDLPADGADLSSVAAGAHELTLSHRGEQYKLAIDVAPAPALTAFVESGQNVGTLVVVTGQDKSRVFLNGKALPQQTQGGQLRIANLEPKEYRVRVEKDGFQDLPEQKIRVRKGEQGRLVFGLLPVPRMASLSIQGGTPGTTVLIDQANAGTVQPDGTLTLSAITPGDHVIELRRDRFKARQIKKHFVLGTPVILAASDTALEASPGELKITFSPADAQVTLTKAGASPVKVASGSPLTLPTGTYVLSARTADNFVRTATVEFTAGQSRNIDLALAPAGMSKWDDPSGWKREDGAFVRKGGDYVLYGVSPTSGTFAFSAMLTKGHRLQWVFNYTDPGNYDLFQMDDNNFYRTDIRNGQKANEAKIPHKSDKKSYRTLQIHVSPTEIVHQIRQGNAWFVLDRWTLPGTNLASGRFGFYIPGGDQVSLANFNHYADLNVH